MNRRRLLTLGLASSTLFLSTGCLCSPVEDVLDVVHAFRWPLVSEDSGTLSDGGSWGDSGPFDDGAVVWDGGVAPAPDDLQLPLDPVLAPTPQNWK